MPKSNYLQINQIWILQLVKNQEAGKIKCTYRMDVSYTDHAYSKVNGNGIKNRMSHLNKVYRK